MTKIGKWLNKKNLEVCEILTDGIIVTDRESRIVYFNHAYQVYSGLSTETTYGKFMNDIRPGSRLLEVMETGKKFKTIKGLVTGLNRIVTLSQFLKKMK